MAYELVMPYHLHMPSYFLETFTEYPYLLINKTHLIMNLFIFCFVKYTGRHLNLLPSIPPYS